MARLLAHSQVLAAALAVLADIGERDAAAEGGRERGAPALPVPVQTLVDGVRPVLLAHADALDVATSGMRLMDAVLTQVGLRAAVCDGAPSVQCWARGCEGLVCMGGCA